MTFHNIPTLIHFTHTLFNQMAQTETASQPKKRVAKQFHTGKGTQQEIRMICNYLTHIHFTNEQVKEEQIANAKAKLQDIKEAQANV